MGIGCVVLRRRLSTGWALSIFLVSAAAMLLFARLWRPPLGAIQQTGWACGALSLLWSVVGAALLRRRRAYRRAPSNGIVGLDYTSALAALLFGVVAWIILVVVLVMRMVFVSLEIVRGHPAARVREYGFGNEGLWNMGVLILSCLVGLGSTRDPRLGTVLFWLVVMGTTWATLLGAPLGVHVTGAFERSAMSVVLLAALSAVLATSVLVTEWSARRPKLGNRKAPPHPAAPSHGTWPGFVTSCGALSFAIIVLCCYHLLIPIRVSWGGVYGAWVMTGLSASLTAAAMFVLLTRHWNENLADAAMGLASIACCGFAMLAVPGAEMPLGDRYPMMFTTMIVGLTVATGIWAYLAGVWSTAAEVPAAGADLVRWVPHAKRSAFLSAALALVAAALMTYWPRLPSIASMDHTLGRVSAGLAAHLFLLLVMLWCSRRLRRLTFHLLTLLAVVSTVGFIVVRMAPFASRLE